MKRVNANILLTERDIGILRFLFEQKVAAREQIATRFFPHATRQAAERRIGKLLRRRLLTDVLARQDGKRTIAFGLTPKGFATATKDYPFEVTGSEWRSEAVAHDVELVNVRARLEKALAVAAYLPENVLQNCAELAISEDWASFARLNSDAAMKIELPSGPHLVGLELELSEKDSSRYVAKLADYYLAPEISAVFFVCGNARIERLIRQADEEASPGVDHKVYTLPLEVIHSSNEPLAFSRAPGATFLLS